MAIASQTERITLVPEGTWELDPARSTAGFTVRHLKVMKVRGRFHELTGRIRADSAGVTSIEGSVEVASIDTGDELRDARLCAEDFLGAARYPTIAFRAISQALERGDVPVVSGKMTVRGVARPIELKLDGLGSRVDRTGDLRLRATGVLSRRAFGLKWDPALAAGGLIIDDQVGLQLDVVLRLIDRRPNG